MRAMNPSYPSNLTSPQWQLLSELIPEGKTGGRKRSVDMEKDLLCCPNVGLWKELLVGLTGVEG